MGLHDKYRIHEVSKDFDIPTEDVLALVTEFFGANAKTNHMTVLTPEQLDVIFDYYSQKKGTVKSLAEYFSSMPTEEEKRKKEEELKKEAAEAAAKKAKEDAEKKAAAAAEEKKKAEEAASRKISEEKKKTAKQSSAPVTQPPVTNNTQTVNRPQTDKPTVNQNGQKKTAQKEREKKRNEFKTRVVPVGKGIEQASPVTVIDNEDKSSDVNGKYVKFVDTRKQTNVDLSKYDERLSDIAGEHDKRDYGKSKQKIKSKNKRPNSYNSKREDELAKLKRLEQYEKDKKKHLSNIVLPEEISVNGLAASLHTTNAEVVKKLMSLGIMASSSQIIDYDTASLVAEELGATVSKQVVVTIEEKLIDDTEDKNEDLVPRSPVVVVMGHVDHGKTSLLDAIKNSNVAAGEAGGITQHIGAYTVKINDKNITFLDTPGHAAFTSMRARGAQVTDIAILVVAGDDGIMPQTVEAINHAKAANVPIIVAVNKMDKPESNFDRVLQALTEYELVPEQWGGDVICVPVSATKHEGIENLLEMIQLVADVADLKANPNRKAKGTVIEAKLDKGRGPVATVLVQNGTLHMGDLLVAGTSIAKVRIMMDDKGNRITDAIPSTPVEITGFSEVPTAGDLFYVVDDERMARELVEQRKTEQKDALNADRSNISLNDLFSQIQQGNVKELKLIVKADVQGSAEAVKSSLEKLSNDEVRVKVIHSAVGGITESDVMLASASKAIIVGFNVRPDPNARNMAEKDKVDLRLYRIIYDCTREIEAAMKGMLAPKFREVSLGTAEVRQTFKVSGVGTIAGCYVKNGKILRSAKVRLIRDSIVVYEGQIDSLKRFKDDAKEVSEGYECGIGLDKFNDIKDGDIIEAFIDEEIKD